MAEGPFVIKRKRIFAADGHHGGAWKVAYADFVTSMMAFFMLLWILGATTEEQRRGIADFFEPTIPIAPVSAGGTDILYGDSVFATDSLLSTGHGGEMNSLLLNEALARTVATLLETSEVNENVRITLSPEGVTIDLMDARGKPIFELGKSGPTELLTKVVEAIAPALKESGRPIKITGHTDNKQFGRTDYTNWELSADRALMARRLALQFGVPREQFYEVSGQADRLPASDDPSAPENRRISVILLNDNGAPLNAR